MDSILQPTHREQIGLAAAAVAPGQVIAGSTRRTITDFDNIAAALLAMNTHPLHSDYDFAARTAFEKPLVVSPFLLSCLIAGIMNELRDVRVVSLKIESLSFTAPVHPGDTISTEAVVEASGGSQIVLNVKGVKADGTSFAQFHMRLETATQ